MVKYCNFEICFLIISSRLNLDMSALLILGFCSIVKIGLNSYALECVTFMECGELLYGKMFPVELKVVVYKTYGS